MVYLDRNYLDGEQSDMSNLTTTVNELSNSELQTESSTMLQYSAISEHSTVKGTPQVIREWLMSSQEDFHVNHTQYAESNWGGQMSGICGLKQGSVFALYNQDLPGWRMLQESFLLDTSEKSLVTFPKSGITQGGVCYLLLIVGLNTKGKEYGFWPTPAKSDGDHHGKEKWIENSRVKRISLGKSPPTEKITYAYYESDIPMRYFPEISEELMMWPLGWTDLEPLGMDKFRQWLEQHGKSCQKD